MDKLKELIHGLLRQPRTGGGRFATLNDLNASTSSPVGRPSGGFGPSSDDDEDDDDESDGNDREAESWFTGGERR